MDRWDQPHVLNSSWAGRISPPVVSIHIAVFKYAKHFCWKKINFSVTVSVAAIPYFAGKIQYRSNDFKIF
jgi:hypothetical protein